MAAKQQNKTLATSLKFIASLIFLYVLFGGPLVIPAQWWAPLVYAVAVVSTIALFFGSLVGFGMSSEMLTSGSKKAVTMSALALLALASTSMFSGSAAGAMVVVGFIIGWFGGVIESK